MKQLYHYKIWKSDLGQYVAQMGRLSADDIRSLGGLIIVEGSGTALDRKAPQQVAPRQTALVGERAASGR